MKVETRTKLIFTKEEQRALADFEEIFESGGISSLGVWYILRDIAEGTNKRAKNYGYEIEITG